ncbi:MAG: type II secretion system F family protein [Raoultibacter sp.]|jgi:tight adherence protein B
METASIISCVAFVSAFFCASFLVPHLVESVQSRRESGRVQQKTLGEKAGFSTVLRNGVSWLKPLAAFLLREPRIRKFCKDAQEIYEAEGFRTTPTSIASIIALLALMCFVVGSVIGSSWIFGLILVVGLVLALVSLVNHQKEIRIDAIRETVPDALRSMSVCSQAGLSLQQTFDQVSSEIEGPLKLLFVHAANDLATGKTVGKALKRFQDESQTNELAFVAVALDVQHKAGGSLRQVLDAARDSVESELELRRNLRVQTAQAKLSARIVSLMPFVLIAVFSFLSPGFLAPFFNSIEGIALLCLAILMQASGILLVRRLLDVGRG